MLDTAKICYNCESSPAQTDGLCTACLAIQAGDDPRERWEKCGQCRYAGEEISGNAIACNYFGSEDCDPYDCQVFEADEVDEDA